MTQKPNVSFSCSYLSLNNSCITFHCKYCGSNFRTRLDLTIHQKKQCGEQLEYKCDICTRKKKIFINEHAYQCHHLMVHGVNIRMKFTTTIKLRYTTRPLRLKEWVQDNGIVYDPFLNGFINKSILLKLMLYKGLGITGFANKCVYTLIKEYRRRVRTYGITNGWNYLKIMVQFIEHDSDTIQKIRKRKLKFENNEEEKKN